MNTLAYGAKQAVQNCIRLQPNERVVIISDDETLAVGRALWQEAELISPGNVVMFRMEEYGRRSDDGFGPLSFPDEIADALEQSQVSFYAATGKKGELATFRKPMVQKITGLGTIRHAHMIDIDERLMREGMAVDYSAIQRVTRNIYHIIKDAKKMYVTTPAGTELEIGFSPRYKWVLSDGLIDKPGMWMNLPTGELYTTPATVDGIMIVDGVLGDYFCSKYGDLSDHPVQFAIKDRELQDVTCSNSSLTAELLEYLSADEHSRKVGETGIGTSTELTSLVGNLLQDEKYPGNHNAFGDPYASKTGAEWNSKTHIDGVMRNCTISIDDYMIMRNGKYIAEILNDSCNVP